jgi:hypothetical protein
MVRRATWPNLARLTDGPTSRACLANLTNTTHPFLSLPVPLSLSLSHALFVGRKLETAVLVQFAEEDVQPPEDTRDEDKGTNKLLDTLDSLG